MTLDRLAAALADRYRLEHELGAGGMATVYLAHDLKHERDVAIKVLHPDLGAALGGERFLSEIRTTARLQHPHILPLLDSGAVHLSHPERRGPEGHEVEGPAILYYVMPLVTGETLRARLERDRQLPIAEAVLVAREVADALGYAHGLGVIHRDIKPENILLQGGHALVADFGIALAVQSAGGQRMTQTGLSLGTPQYMSPEQAMGEKQIDARSDVYALGAVTYEMLAGDPPFTGSSVQAIVAKVMTEKPSPLRNVRDTVPDHLEAAVLTALAKLPADRFASARAFADALGSPALTAMPPTTTRSAPRVQDWRQRSAVPALLIAGLLAVAVVSMVTRSTPPLNIARYMVALPDDQGLSRTFWSRLAVSPDGSRLVYVADEERGTRLVARARDQLDATALPGTEGAVNPVFSPDGTRIAFMHGAPQGDIRVVSLAGGAAVVITDSAVGGPGLTWGYDGYIYYDAAGIGPLMRVPEKGGTGEPISTLNAARGELQHVWPDALPNGKGLLMTVSRGGPGAGGSEADEIAALDLVTGTHRILANGVYARYVKPSQLVYVTADGVLMGAPFDPDRMELTGEAVALAEGVGVRIGGGAVDLTVSANGTLWYVAGTIGSPGTQEVVWVDRDGSATPVAEGWAGLIFDPVLSPEGTRLAVSMWDPRLEIRIRELDDGPLSKLTIEGSRSMRPAWSSDGQSIAFVAERLSDRHIYQRPADGSRPAMLLLDAGRPVEEATFSRDGNWLIYRSGSSVGEADLYARRLGTDSSITLVATPAYETSPSLSPDGRWLAYVSNESGTTEVYVRPFPNTDDARWQISVEGGQEPLWAHSGRELFYRSTGGTIPEQMALEILPGETFRTGARRALFPLSRFLVSFSHQQYAVAPGDQRFIMIRFTGSERADQLVVVENFSQVLKTAVEQR